MATTIAEYFTDELSEWKRMIASYTQEMHGLTVKLAEVIQRNSIPGIAAKVENQQAKLNMVLKKIFRLQIQFQRQEEALKTDSTFIDDSLIKTETEKQQKDLRQRTQQVEREYSDIKNDCHNFLSEIFKK